MFRNYSGGVLISKDHRNRRAHNWLVYDCMDRMMEGYSNLYRGVIYDLGAGESPYKEYFLNYADRYVAVDWAGSYHRHPG